MSKYNLISLQSAISMVIHASKSLDCINHLSAYDMSSFSEKKICNDFISCSLFFTAITDRFCEIYLLICLNTCVCMKTFRLLLIIFNILFSTLLSVSQTWRLDWQSLTWKSKMVLLETFILKEHLVFHLVFSFVKLCHIRLKASTKKWIVKSPLCQTANIWCQSLSKQPVSLGHISFNHRTIWSGVLWEWTSPSSRNSIKSTDRYFMDCKQLMY